MPTNPSQQEELYGNWRLLAPDGELLAMIDAHRSNWYLKRNLATKIDEKTIRLLFEPNGRGNLVIFKKNICVVCGTTDNLNKHHVVPRIYRKEMPTEIKDRSSHDIVSVCTSCHMLYEDKVSDYKKYIDEKYCLQSKTQEVQLDLLTARKAAGAIKEHRDSLPADRVKYLQNKIADYFHETYSEDLLDRILQIRPKSLTQKNFKERFKEIDLNEFCRSWRKHFVDTMNPQFLPEQWSIEGPEDEKAH